MLVRFFAAFLDNVAKLYRLPMMPSLLIGNERLYQCGISLFLDHDQPLGRLDGRVPAQQNICNSPLLFNWKQGDAKAL